MKCLFKKWQKRYISNESNKAKIQKKSDWSKKNSEWKYDEEYVYDLTIENHHFHRGLEQMILHNTDSIYIDVGYNTIEKTFKFNRLLEKLYFHYKNFSS